MQGEAVSSITQRLVAPVLGVNSPVVQHFANMTESVVALETGVRGLLNSAGIPTILYPFYLDYARELWQLTTRGYSIAEGGTSVGAVEAAALQAKWVARGLVLVFLQAVRAYVAGLQNVVPPPELLLPGHGTGVPIPITLSVTAVPAAQNYHYRVYAEDIIIAEKADAVTETWLVTPALAASQFYSWTARVKVAGLWSEFASPVHEFYTLPA